MGNILIVEDNKLIRDDLIRMAKCVDSSVEVFATGLAEEAFDFAVNNHVSAFFLDIQLEDYSGLELAKKIRKIKLYEFAPITFITAIPTRELEAFRQIHCYDYIIKPYTQVELEIAFSKILIDYISCTRKEKNDKLALKFNGYTQIIDLKDIMYVEYVNRKIVIKTKKDSIQYIHMPLKKFKKMLSDEFFQIHQSVVVNCDYVEGLESCNQRLRLIDEQTVLPIGRSYKKEVGDRINELH